MHDDLAQQISALKMDLDAGGLIKFGNAAGDILTSVRNLSYLLHPPLLEEAGLRAALHWFVEGLSNRSKIEVSLAMGPENFPRLPNEIETAIFRVVQEALTNVYRHSGSDNARVEIERLSDTIVLRVRDFGKRRSFQFAAETHRANTGRGDHGNARKGAATGWGVNGKAGRAWNTCGSSYSDYCDLESTFVR